MFGVLTDIWQVYRSVFEFALVGSALGLSMYVVLRAGLLSLASAGFMAIGAYVGALMTIHLHTPLLLSVLGGALAAGCIGLLLGLPVLRLSGVYLAIATIGFGEVVRVFMLNIDKLAGRTITGGSLGLNNIPRKTETWHLVLLVAVLVYLFIRIDRSRSGRALDAIRQDDHVAASMGINVVMYRNLAFVLSALIAGAAGVLSAHMTYFISPNEYGFNGAVRILTFAILGGYMTWLGPIVGAFILTFLPELLRFLGPYRPIVNGVILILAIIYLPRGLVDPRFWRKTLRRGSPSPPAAPLETSGQA
ncbi:MAG: branched-chain amino acid ABC transporter permease [Caldilineales bacterium]